MNLRNAGSLVNVILTEKFPKEIEINTGATECLYTDRRAGTIVEVLKNKIVFQYDDSVRTDNNGISEVQEYKYFVNTNNEKKIFRLTKNGWKSKGGSYLSIGYRNEYYDYSF